MIKLSIYINNFLYRWRIIRFLISGGTAFSVNIAMLYFFTDIIGLWYIYSATISFVVSLLIGFSLNKIWTFKNNLIEKIPTQLRLYFFVNLFNLVLNNTILYILVEEFGVWYILAQVFASILIACESFFAYKFIFHEKDQLKSPVNS